MAKRALYRALLTGFLAIAAFWTPSAAQEATGGGPRLLAEALTVESQNGETLYQFRHFQVTEYDGYSVEGAGGTYERAAELLRAWGDANQKVKIAKEGEESFTITAAKSLEIHFASESLRAEGEVEYRASGTAARAQLLLVDEWQRLQELVASLLSSLADEESRALVEGFFAGLEPEGRLVLLLGGVEIERDDAQLVAEWAALAEGDERFVSAGGQAPIELRLSRER